MEGALWTLPPEVIARILENSAPEDLFNLILASRYCNNIFKATPKRFLLGSLKSGIPPKLWPEFCAAHFASAFERNMPRDLAEVDEANIVYFLHHYVGTSDNFEILSDSTVEQLVSAHRLHRQISYFVSKFAQSAIAEAHKYHQFQLSCDYLSLPNTDQAQREESSDISVSVNLSFGERFRLYRAFLRFEIYARVFRPPQIRFRHFAQWQLSSFSNYFPVWEREEMACVHTFLLNIIQSTFDDMDRAFEEEVRRLERVTWQTEGQWPAYDPENPVQQLFFDQLFNFSDGYRSIVVPRSSSIASRGLDYLHRFCRMDQRARFTALQTNPLTAGRLIPHAVPTETSYGWSVYLSFDYHDTAQPSLGFVRLNEGGSFLHPYLHMDGPESWAMSRAIGYTFWDPSRLDSKPFQMALRCADDGIFPLNPPSKPRVDDHSIENMFGRVYLMTADIRRLVEDFAMFNYVATGTPVYDL